MKNGKRIVLEAAEGITFRLQEGKDEIVIKAVRESENPSRCIYSYREPYIPEGYRHVYGDLWNAGFVIENLDDGSQFVWIPAGWLDADATLDEKNFNEKFGRMNWHNSDFSISGYHEEISPEFIESVKKYGGYYFARFHASKEDGKLVFKKGKMPWVDINYDDAKELAANYARCSKDVVSQITSGAAFDTVLRWIIKSRAKTIDEVVKNSASWGNYHDTTRYHKRVMHTGSNEKWCAMGIYDLAGNIDEWTSEMFRNSCRVLRGGNFRHEGADWSAAHRYDILPDEKYFNTGFRAVLYLK